MTTRWWRGAVFYQVYPRSFADADGDGVGDLAGITGRLDHLEWLGVDAIWLSPFYPSPMADFGYDVADYTDVDPALRRSGGVRPARREAVHARGMRVIIDWVPNHTSDRHPWFAASRSSRGDPRRDWYVWRDGRPGGAAPERLGVDLRRLRVDLRRGDRPVVPALLRARAARPQLGEPRGGRGDARRRCASGWTAAWTASGSTSYRSSGSAPTRPRAAGRGRATRSGPRGHEIVRRVRSVLDEYDDRMAVGEVYVLDQRRLARSS